MSTTIRGLFRPALNLLTVVTVTGLMTFGGAASAEPPALLEAPDTVAVVTPYGEQCSVLRFEADGERVVDLHGEGPLLRALATVWVTVPPAA